MSAFRRAYGAGFLHLAAVLATVAVSAYAISRIYAVIADPNRVVLWLGGAIVVHDLLLFPLYGLAGVVAAAALAPRGHPSRLGVAALNHLRAASLMSGLLALVWFPLIAAKAPGTFARTSGLDVGVYRERWLIATAVLFGGSALLLALRAPFLARRPALPES
jgi:hypothetical protein